MNLAALLALAQQVGFPDPNLAAAIAMVESGGNPSALNDNPPREHSVGLWQINTLAWPQFNSALLTDPVYNAKAALAIYKQVGWKPWTSYTSGRYLKYYTPPSNGWRIVIFTGVIIAGAVGVMYAADWVADTPKARRLVAGR